MKRKPSRTFVYLALIIVFLFAIGLILIDLIPDKGGIPPFEFTVSAIEATNSAIVATATANARRTSIPTYPYEPTLYAQRRQETFLLMTAGAPTEYAIFFATETALVATYQGTPAPLAHFK